jgi:hypothetical protein
MSQVFELDKTTHVCLQHYFGRDGLKVQQVFLKGLQHRSQSDRRDFAEEAGILHRWNESSAL